MEGLGPRWGTFEIIGFFDEWRERGKAWTNSEWKPPEQLKGRSISMLEAFFTLNEAFFVQPVEKQTAQGLCKEMEKHYKQHTILASPSLPGRRNARRTSKRVRKLFEQEAVEALFQLGGTRNREKPRETTDSEPASALAKRLKHTLSHTERFVRYEWLYAPIDKPFFEYCEYDRLLEERGLKEVKLTRREWAVVRSSFGRPRRFSAAFLKAERGKLEKHRARVRLLEQGRVPIRENESEDDAQILLMEGAVPQALELGMFVTFVYSGKLRVGRIVRVEPSMYTVETEGRKRWRVPDTDVMQHASTFIRPPSRAPGSVRRPVTQKVLSWRIVQAMGSSMALLIRKQALVSLWETMHDEFEAGVKVSAGEQKKYAWVLTELQAVNKELAEHLYLLATVDPRDIIVVGVESSEEIFASLGRELTRTCQKIALELGLLQGREHVAEQQPRGDSIDLLASCISVLKTLKDSLSEI